MKYIAFSPETQVTGRSVILMFDNPFPYTNPSIPELLAAEGLINIKEEQWYSQQQCLNVLEQIEKHHGSEALYQLGKSVFEKVSIYRATDMEAEFLFLDTGYQLTHQFGEIGYYELIEYNEEKHYAVVECYNPYPSAFDAGILEALARKHVGADTKVEIILDTTKENRPAGGSRCFFTIKW
jgi:hypothetical protein